MRRMIIFGAGRTADYLYEMAVFTGYQVAAFADNDETKWGKTIRGVTVISPDRLQGKGGIVLVNDKYLEEITRQLKALSYQGKVIGRAALFEEMVTKKYDREKFASPVFSKDLTYVIDSYFWQSDWGGVESFSCLVDEALRKRKCRTAFLCGNNQKFDEVVSDCIHYCGNNEIEDMRRMIDDIIARLPCIVLSHASAAFFAAMIVKGLYPEKIKIVMVVHADIPVVYERIAHWIGAIDTVIGISDKIAKTCVEEYGMPADKVVYHVNPMQLSEKKADRKINGGSLRIGFAARLHSVQKRAHLLPQIIDECFRRGLDVAFYIAGEGDCHALLQNYITTHHLEGKVHLLGWIPPTKMEDFWREQDIYLNISDYEGMSLTMLEAMAFGAFPVVTDVSGVSDVVENGKNGFVFPVDRFMDCVEKIAVLDADRELLRQGGRYNIDFIREKCDVDQYAKWFMETFTIPAE